MQGAKIQVMHFNSESDKFINQSYTHKATNTVTKVFTLNDIADIRQDIVGLELKFLELDEKKFKDPIVHQIIKTTAKRKINKKIVDFSKQFKGNEVVVENFIIGGDFNRTSEILERLDFIASFVDKFGYKVNDSESFVCENKALIQIDLEEFSEIDKESISEFLTEFDQKRFDYIVIHK